MVQTFNGQCQCGCVKYRVDGTPATMFVCHCTECQRQSSSAFGMALWIEEPVVRILRGELKEWVRRTPSGKNMVCSFCPDCGTRLFHKVLEQPRFLSIKPGTLDDCAALAPVGHIWTSSKQAWVSIPPTSLQYPENPPGFEELLAAWRASQS